jgi:uncharacterized protein (DUF433 family)
MSTDPTTPLSAALDLDAITDGATGWDRDWVAQLPGHLPASAYLAPYLRWRAQRELAALLADVDRLVAEVRRLRGAVPAATGPAILGRALLDENGDAWPTRPAGLYGFGLRTREVLLVDPAAWARHERLADAAARWRHICTAISPDIGQGDVDDAEADVWAAVDALGEHPALDGDLADNPTEAGALERFGIDPDELAAVLDGEPTPSTPDEGGTTAPPDAGTDTPTTAGEASVQVTPADGGDTGTDNGEAASLRDVAERREALISQHRRYMESCIWVDLGRMSGAPCLGGTRIRVETIAGLLADGLDGDQIRDHYPDVTDQHLVAVRHFVAEVDAGSCPEDELADGKRALYDHVVGAHGPSDAEPAPEPAGGPGWVDRRGWTRQQWLDDARAIFNSVHGGAADLLNGHIVALFAELHDVTEQRDLAIAHDRQPYPTAAAYEAVCATLERKRAELDDTVQANHRWAATHAGLEAELAEVREELARMAGGVTDLRATVAMRDGQLRDVSAELEYVRADREGLDLQRNRLLAERATARRDVAAGVLDEAATGTSGLTAAGLRQMAAQIRAGTRRVPGSPEPDGGGDDG